jgi:hypothetical protein
MPEKWEHRRRRQRKECDDFVKIQREQAKRLSQRRKDTEEGWLGKIDRIYRNFFGQGSRCCAVAVAASL